MLAEGMFCRRIEKRQKHSLFQLSPEQRFHVWGLYTWEAACIQVSLYQKRKEHAGMNVKVQKMRTDNKEVENLLRKEGICHDKTVPNSPQQNSILMIFYKLQ